MNPRRPSKTRIAVEILRRLRDPLRAARTARLVAGTFLQGGLRATMSVLEQGQRKPQLIDDAAYARWVSLYDTLEADDLARLREEAMSLAVTPSISVLMPVYDTPAAVLEEAIESVFAQVYPHWELCIADDASTADHVRPILERHRDRDPRVKVTFRPTNGHIVHATNAAFELAGGEWVAFLDHDDVLRPHALLEVAKAIAAHPSAGMVYSDEDKLDPAGRRIEPFFKPDHSPELLLAMNYLNHLTVHRAANVRAVGGWRPGFEGSQDYDLNLRVVETLEAADIVHIPRVLYHWRASESSAASEASQKPYALSAGRRAVSEHLRRRGVDATVETIPEGAYHRIRRAGPEPAPLVSIIIPTRDHAALLRRSIGSIRSRTLYPRFEIVVVDNQSRDRETIDYLGELEARGVARVLRHDDVFNFSAINNHGVRAANGTIVCLMNDDVEPISPGWLEEMVSLACDEAVGCVGPKLRYADRTIQHAGIVLGIGGVAGHPHKHEIGTEAGYFGRLAVTRDVSAVTGACLVVRKELYEAVGGLNETALAVAFNDVDFCLRVREAGYRNVFTPFAELLHLESASRGAEDDPIKLQRFAGESAYMRERWGPMLDADPFYSPNLSLDREDVSLADPPRRKRTSA